MTEPGPGQGTPPVSDDAAIRAYLRQHMGQYTHQALDAQLRAAGHSDEAIAAAWAVDLGLFADGPGRNHCRPPAAPVATSSR